MVLPDSGLLLLWRFVQYSLFFLALEFVSTWPRAVFEQHYGTFCHLQKLHLCALIVLCNPLVVFATFGCYIVIDNWSRCVLVHPYQLFGVSNLITIWSLRLFEQHYGCFCQFVSRTWSFHTCDIAANLSFSMILGHLGSLGWVSRISQKIRSPRTVAVY